MEGYLKITAEEYNNGEGTHLNTHIELQRVGVRDKQEIIGAICRGLEISPFEALLIMSSIKGMKEDDSDD